jgi:protein-S-isoprenylcysteine O-methyltransferase Ste14
VWPGRIAGVLGLAGAALAIGAARSALGGRLPVNPDPGTAAELQQGRIYAAVRHPTYAGSILGTLSWAVLWSTPAGLALAGVCAAFYVAKARYEERLLEARFPAYVDYRRRVPPFLPRLAARRARVR